MGIKSDQPDGRLLRGVGGDVHSHTHTGRCLLTCSQRPLPSQASVNLLHERNKLFCERPTRPSPIKYFDLPWSVPFRPTGGCLLEPCRRQVPRAAQQRRVVYPVGPFWLDDLCTLGVPVTSRTNNEASVTRRFALTCGLASRRGSLLFSDLPPSNIA